MTSSTNTTTSNPTLVSIFDTRKHSYYGLFPLADAAEIVRWWNERDGKGRYETASPPCVLVAPEDLSSLCAPDDDRFVAYDTRHHHTFRCRGYADAAATAAGWNSEEVPGSQRFRVAYVKSWHPSAERNGCADGDSCRAGRWCPLEPILPPLTPFVRYALDVVATVSGEATLREIGNLRFVRAYAVSTLIGLGLIRGARYGGEPDRYAVVTHLGLACAGRAPVRFYYNDRRLELKCEVPDGAIFSNASATDLGLPQFTPGWCSRPPNVPVPRPLPSRRPPSDRLCVCSPPPTVVKVGA